MEDRDPPRKPREEEFKRVKKRAIITTQDFEGTKKMAFII